MSLKPLDFRGRWVLVTGASSGLGLEMAKVLARGHGANLLIVARRQERLEALANELRSSAGVEVATSVADLSSLADVDRVIEEGTVNYPVYVAILNAGVTHFGRYEDL